MNERSEHSDAVPTELRCEYARNPLGVATTRPRLSWRAAAHGKDRAQRAYRLLVASDPSILDNGSGDLWDSGVVESSQSTNVEYDGVGLVSRTAGFWTVRIWDEEGRASAFSEPAHFELALLERSDWSAQWITSPWDARHHSPLIRHAFHLPATTRTGIARARAYICGLGYYELSVNGTKISDHVLDPGWTDYSKRVLYVVHDVTSHLRPGANALGVMLGNGWRCNPGFASDEYFQRAGGPPVLLLQLEIEYTDGSRRTIASEPTAQWQCARGPIGANSIYRGEHYDARLAQPGWDAIDFEPCSAWRAAVTALPPGGVLEPQTIEPIKVMSHLNPVSVTEPTPGEYVFDLGQNIAGWVRLQVEGPRGTEVTMRFAETLYRDGTVNQENLRLDTVQDTYVLAGNGKETYEPRFTYHGFRYIQVSGLPAPPSEGSITGCVVRSSVDPAGVFQCSNELLNKIHTAVVWTESNNLHSVPTDCPQRNERAGWLNDATVRAQEAIYNFDMARLFGKWVQDIADTQDARGAIMNTAPDIVPLRPGYWEHTHADAVSTSFLLIPWLLYLHYGDTRVLARHFDALCRWAQFLTDQSEGDIVTFSQMGDWASPAEYCDRNSVGSGAVSVITPGALISTGYHYYNALLLSKIAGVLGKNDQQQHYARRAKEIAQAFNSAFLDREECAYGTDTYPGGSQASNVFPLYLGIVPAACKNGVLERIVADIARHDGHLTTGNLCSRYLLEALTDAGRGDVAVQIATQETYPSWGFMLANGATTIWERWELGTGAGMNSHDHPMYGSIGAWLYGYLAGIRADEQQPAFGRFTVRPAFIGCLDEARAELQTLVGPLAAHWHRDTGRVVLEVQVPFNATAVVVVPGDGEMEEIEVGSGSHRFEIDAPAAAGGRDWPSGRP